MIKIFLCLFAVVFLQSALARQGGDTLPYCVDNAKKVAAITAQIKANGKTKAKYNAYKKALASDSDRQLMARLVYAEVKAARCAELNDKLVEVIAAVIANRVKIKNGNIKAVVYEKDQFASSLNIYSESNYKDFLCPNDLKLWNLSLQATSAALSAETKATATVNYFLYKHSSRWKKEPWQLEEDLILVSPEIRGCIKAFKNADYK